MMAKIYLMIWIYLKSDVLCKNKKELIEIVDETEANFEI